MNTEILPTKHTNQTKRGSGFRIFAPFRACRPWRVFRGLILLFTLSTIFYLPSSVRAQASSEHETITGIGFLKNVNYPPKAIPASNAIDWVQAKIYTRTLAANTTFSFANSVSGQTIIVFVTNIAVTATPTPPPSPTPTPTPGPLNGDFTVTWPSGIKWAGGSAPTQTTGAHTDKYVFEKVGTVIYGSVTQNY